MSTKKQLSFVLLMHEATSEFDAHHAPSHAH